MHRRRAFSLIELLVVIAVISILIGLLLPALGAARLQARITTCGARLQQIGVGTTMYINQFNNLPQKLGPLPTGGESVIGSLFAGKKGQLPFYGIDKIGAQGRPLNSFVVSQDVPSDDSTQNIELKQFQSPIDKGSGETGLPIPGLDKTESMYDFIGCSYLLNDHTLDGEEVGTLVPPGGGRMREPIAPTRTWLIGTHTIYNYQQDGDRKMRWFNEREDGRGVQANLLFFDMHVKTGIKVPKGIVNTTPDYTFLVNPDKL